MKSTFGKLNKLHMYKVKFPVFVFDKIWIKHWNPIRNRYKPDIEYDSCSSNTRPGKRLKCHGISDHYYEHSFTIDL